MHLNNILFEVKALWMKVTLPFSMVLAHINADLSWAIFSSHLALLMKERKVAEDVLVIFCIECIFEDDFCAF